MNDISEPTPSSLPDIDINFQSGGSDPSIPYIISPRHSFLLNNKPTFCWNKVPGVTNYVVRLTKDSEILWEKRVNGSNIDYFEEPPLEPGVVYSLVVEANNGLSSLSSTESLLGFQLIDEKTAQEVEQAVTEIAQRDNLSPEVKAILKARLFNSLNLTSEAIKILEQLLSEHRFSQDSQKATVFLTLAKLYGGVGLNLLAQDHYSRAIALSTSAEDLQVKAQAQAGLAGVKLMLAQDKTTQAIQLSSEAQNTYIQLGNTETTQKIQSSLIELANRLVELADSFEAGRAEQESNIAAIHRPSAAKFPPCQPWRNCIFN